MPKFVACFLLVEEHYVENINDFCVDSAIQRLNDEPQNPYSSLLTARAYCRPRMAHFFCDPSYFCCPKFQLSLRVVFSSFPEAWVTERLWLGPTIYY
jgi:hypothetical protein